ncbi:type III polyketide synthase [Rhodohalobacter sp. 8-1]|uniref:type III polyketide synthase n=1 Tax=Rhodohalobacter sp. 8-1 TaxID=3131972 RepID=UPI0030EF390A
MSSYIHQIQTATPEFKYSQDELRDRMKEIVGGDEKDQRLLHHIYGRSGIQTRHSVVDDFKSNGSFELFFNGQGATPGTKSRNDTYIKKGRQLYVDVARKLMNASDLNTTDITHLITVSCTGFYAPGPDYDIIKSLGLPSSIERYHLGFMGCYAVLPALKLASQLCEANKDANVMVVSVELCTLHFQARPVMDDMISASVFADGGAGTIVSGKQPGSGPHFSLDGFESAITDKGKDDMAWSIGDQGFNMTLSTYVPDILSSELDSFLNPIFEKYAIAQDDINLWGIHPGGRAILDKFESTLSLEDGALNASRSVLANYGNMSSATILFVLKELLESSSSDSPQKAIAMAFGPGLTIESALLTKQS